MSGSLKPLAGLFYFRDRLDSLRDSLGWALGATALALGLGEVIASGESTVGGAFSSLAVSVFFLVAMPWLILHFSNRDERFNRTLLALAAVDIVSIILTLPGLFLFASGTWPEAVPKSLLIPAVVWMLAVVVWIIAVKTLIWSYATSRSALACFFLVCFLLVSEIAAQSFLPF